MTADTTLTGAQNVRLLEMESDETARVVGWSIRYNGPVVRRGDVEHAIRPNGRLQRVKS